MKFEFVSNALRKNARQRRRDQKPDGMCECYYTHALVCAGVCMREFCGLQIKI